MTYERQLATAERLIEAKGQLVTWRKIVDGSPTDPDTPWKPAQAIVTDFQVSIVFLPYNQMGSEWLSLARNTEVPKGSLYGLMAAPTAFTPSIKDNVVRGSTVLAIETINELSPNGENILYEIRFRT